MNKRFFLPLLALASFLFIMSCKKSESNLLSVSEKKHKTKLYPNLSNAEIKDGVFEGRKIKYARINGLNIFEGDILLTDQQVESKAFTEGVIYNNKLWPDKTIYYTFNPGLSQTTKNSFFAAVAEWEKLDFVFIPRTTETNYILIVNDLGCFAQMGMIGGVQAMSIGDNDCALHETGHALGLEHEHSRPDRDAYININTNNIERGLEFNFNKCNDCVANGSFDFSSIMLYGSYDFAIDPTRPVITKKDGSTFSAQATVLSYNDKSFVLAKYPSGIRKSLEVNKWRTALQLKTMSAGEMRNVSIVELSNRSADSLAYRNSFTNQQLAEWGYMYLWLVDNNIRTQAQLKNIPLSDFRNTVIVELNNRCSASVSLLSALNNGELNGLCYTYSWLKNNGIRSEAQLKVTSPGDIKNTVIVELAARKNIPVSTLQGCSNEVLASIAYGWIVF